MKLARKIPVATRRYIYGVAAATGPVLIAYGAVSGDIWPLWLALAEAVLVPALAIPNTPASES